MELINNDDGKSLLIRAITRGALSNAKEAVKSILVTIPRREIVHITPDEMCALPVTFMRDIEETTGTKVTYLAPLVIKIESTSLAAVEKGKKSLLVALAKARRKLDFLAGK